MKLIGSNTEDKIRAALLQSHRSLFLAENRRLLDTIRQHHPSMKTAYILGWLPEQGEDIYTVLINLNTIIRVEIDRINAEVPALVSQVDFNDFKKKLRTLGRLNLTIALQLAQEDMCKLGE